MRSLSRPCKSNHSKKPLRYVATVRGNCHAAITWPDDAPAWAVNGGATRQLLLGFSLQPPRQRPAHRADPRRWTTCGLFAALSLMVSIADCTPAAFGMNCMPILHFDPAGSV